MARVGLMHEFSLPAPHSANMNGVFRNDGLCLPQVTYCEVYCEVLRDLLSEQQPARLAGAGPHKKGHSGIDVVEASGVMRLKGVTPAEVRSMEVRNTGV